MRPTGADANNMNHRNNGPYLGKLFTHSDERGSLGVAEFSGLPFVPKRFFWLHAVSEGSTRASHGHRECEQLVFVQQGTISGFTLDATNSRMSLNSGSPISCMSRRDTGFNWRTSPTLRSLAFSPAILSTPMSTSTVPTNSTPRAIRAQRRSSRPQPR